MAKKVSQLYSRIGSPPDELTVYEFIVKVNKPLGNSFYSVNFPDESLERLGQLIEQELKEFEVEKRLKKASLLKVEPQNQDSPKTEQEESKQESAVSEENKEESSADIVVDRSNLPSYFSKTYLAVKPAQTYIKESSTEGSVEPEKSTEEPADEEKPEAINSNTFTAQMPPKFRNTLLVKRGGLCLVQVVPNVKVVIPTSSAKSTNGPPSAIAEKLAKFKGNNNAKGKGNKGRNAKKGVNSKKATAAKEAAAAAAAQEEANVETTDLQEDPKKLDDDFMTIDFLLEVTNVVVNEKEWSRMPYWPEEYKKTTKGWDSLDNDEVDKEEEDEDEDPFGEVGRPQIL